MGEGSDYNQLCTINDSWNTTSEVVRDKNQPSFIGVMDQGHTEGIVQLRMSSRKTDPTVSDFHYSNEFSAEFEGRHRIDS
jgi:hypothetical protein